MSTATGQGHHDPDNIDSRKEEKELGVGSSSPKEKEVAKDVTAVPKEAKAAAVPAESEKEMDTVVETEIESEEMETETETQVTAKTGGKEVASPRTTSENQPSKKRPREEDCKEALTDAGGAAALEEATAKGLAECEEASKHAESVRQDQGPAVEPVPAGAPGLHALKPLDDPKVCQVVSQDLATQEIRRVRRKENGPPATLAPSGAPAERRMVLDGGRLGESHKEGAEAGKGGTGGDAPSADAAPSLANGAAPAEQSKRQANGGMGGGGVRSTEEQSVKGGTRAEGAARGSCRNSEAPIAGSVIKGESGNALSSKEAGAEDVGRGTGQLSGGRDPSPLGSFASATQDGSGKETEARVTPEVEEEEEADGEKGGEEKGVKEGRGCATGKAAKKRTTRAACPDHVLPVARTFFDFETISSLEMRILPEFFTGRSASKTPEMYMQARNYMVRLYQRMLEADPEGQAFLTGTECRRKLAGDACSILRIHDFLDRFGLINTRSGGRRPPPFPVEPPSMHLWKPTPRPAPTSSISSSRRASGGGGHGAGAPAEREGDRGAAVEGKGWNKAGAGQLAEGVSGREEREWDREELVLLMEAAMANPHQWNAVARQVAGGRTPAACMKRFLNLAVEEVVEGNGGKGPSASAPATPGAPSVGGPTTPETGSTAAVTNSTKGVGVHHRGYGCREDQREREELDQQRPPHLGQAMPALVLASTLISHVHPEVLMAAMAAATKAADDVARRTPVVKTAMNQGSSSRGSLGGGSNSNSGGVGGVVPTVSAWGRGNTSENREEPLAKRKVDGSAPSLASGVAGGGRGDMSSPDREMNPNTVANSGQRRADRSPPQEEASLSLALPHANRDSRSVGGSRFSSASGLELAGAARAAVLSVAGLQAHVLAEQEDRRTEALLGDLLEARVRRLEAKLHCFDELDQVLDTERQALEHDRAELLLEQARSMLAK